MVYTIYLRTNLINGKQYVGQSAIVYAVLYSKKHISKGYKWSYEPL